MIKFLFSIIITTALCSCKGKHPSNEIYEIAAVAAKGSAPAAAVAFNLPTNADDDNNKDSAILKSIDSLTSNWQEISRANPENNFQKQYAGTIGNKQAVFNINLRAINIREQKDIIIWATVGDTLSEFYFNENMLYGNPIDEVGMAICPQCQSPKLIFEKKKYLAGYSDDELLVIRFSNDSSQVEGYMANRLKGMPIVHFTLNKSAPSLPLNYFVYRFHKHQQMKGGEVTEVASTVELAFDSLIKTLNIITIFSKFKQVVLTQQMH